MNELFEAIKTCRRLKDNPINKKYLGDGVYEYNPQTDIEQIKYNIARDFLQRHYPILEKLLKKWL